MCHFMLNLNTVLRSWLESKHIYLRKNLTLLGSSGGTNGTCVEQRKDRFKEHKIQVLLCMNDQTCNKVTYVLWLILDDVVLALTTTGTVKVWTLFGHETKNSEPFYENESKQIRCLNALSMTCCAYNQRTVLIVCSKYWQVITVNCIWKTNVLNVKKKIYFKYI